MEGKTHRIGGTVCAMAGFVTLKDSGYLLSSELISPALQFLVIYTAGIYGGMWPDNDHHWESSPLKDPASWLQNKLMHIANAPYKRLDEKMSSKQKKRSVLYKTLKFMRCIHRSWQTHSEFTLLMILWLMMSPTLLGFTGRFDSVLWLLIVTGFGLGVISHIILDMLTTEGVRFALGVFIKVFFPSVPIFTTIRLVPGISAFKTGSEWEMAIRKALSLIQYALLIMVLLDLAGVSILSYFS
jgi:hypothetical protein